MAEQRSLATGGRVLDRVRYPASPYSPTEAHLAAILLEDPDRAVQESVAQLAGRAAVSVGSVIRLAKHLGFDGYAGLRIALARDLGWDREPAAQGSDERESFGRHLDAQREAIALAGRTIDASQFEAAVSLLSTAEMTEIAASGASASLAEYALFKLTALGRRCRFLHDPWDQSGAAAFLGREDVLLALSFSGRTRGIVDAAERASAAGAAVIALTCNRKAPVCRFASVHLVVDPEASLAGELPEWALRAGLFSVLNATLGEMTARLPALPRGQRRRAWASGRFEMRYPDLEGEPPT